MSLILKKNHYETLGIGPDAAAEEVQKAYELSKRLFSEGSQAAYSLYSEDERAERLEALEEALRTLSDSRLRKEYDEALAKAPAQDGTYEVDLGYIFGERSKTEGAEQAPARAVPPASSRMASLTGQLAALDKAEHLAAEQLKLLSSKLELANKKTGQKVIAFTSAIKGEGKSVLSLNTAYILATSFAKNVVFVECDLRKPSSLSEYVSAEGPGLAEVLKGEATLEDAVSELEGTGLRLIHSGAYNAESADLIGSSGTSTVINRLRAGFDLVVLDCPPVIPLADMSIIEKLVDSMVLVVRAGQTSRELVKSATESLDKKKFIGAVLNGADTKLEKYYY